MDRLPIWALYVAVFAPSVIAGVVAAWGVFVNMRTAALIRRGQARDETGRNLRAALELACSNDKRQRSVGNTQLEVLVEGGALDNEQMALAAATLAQRLAPTTASSKRLPS